MIVVEEWEHERRGRLCAEQANAQKFREALLGLASPLSIAQQFHISVDRVREERTKLRLQLDEQFARDLVWVHEQAMEQRVLDGLPAERNDPPMTREEMESYDFDEIEMRWQRIRALGFTKE